MFINYIIKNVETNEVLEDLIDEIFVNQILEQGYQYQKDCYTRYIKPTKKEIDNYNKKKSDKELQLIKDIKINRLKAIINILCDKAIVTIKNKEMNADWESGINVNVTKETMNMKQLDTINWKCYDNTFIELTLQELITLGLLIFEKQNNYRNVIKENYRIQINNCQSIEEVNAIDIESLLNN
jgi:hypothetical protein